MRFLSIFILLAGLSSTCLSQDIYDVELIPTALKNRANACVRNEETTVDMQAADNVLITVNKAITVFNENGEKDANLILYYDKNTVIKSIKGEIYNAVGKLSRKFNQSNFEDYSAADGFSLFVDDRFKYFAPNVNEFPYTIVYQYEIKQKQNLILPPWEPKAGDAISVEKSTYTFISKPNDEVRIKTTNYNEQPEITSNEKQKMMVWKATNLSATRTEIYAPDPETYLIRICIAPKQFYYFNRKGTYTNWQELGKWIYNDLLKDKGNLPPATVLFIKDLVKDEKTDLDKAKKIYQYLQNKTRYISVQIGIGGFQPITAAEVDRLGYGDCKALVNYMQSLLKAADIESLYCIVKAGSNKKSLNPNYASMDQANHIILCMPLKGDTTWLECTSQKIPFGFLSDFTDDRLVLACTAEGGKLLHTPKLTTTANRQIRIANLTIKDDGTAIGNLKTTFYGAQYDNHENIIDKPINEQHKLLKTDYNIDNIDFQSVSFKTYKDINPKLEETVDLSLRNYASVNNSRVFLQVNAFNVGKTIPELKNRRLPIYINRGYVDEDNITYQLPENIDKNSIFPFDKKLNSKFGSYSVKVEINENKIIYYRKFILDDGTYPAEQYEAFAKFINEISDLDNLKVSMSLKK